MRLGHVSVSVMNGHGSDSSRQKSRPFEFLHFLSPWTHAPSEGRGSRGAGVRRGTGCDGTTDGCHVRRIDCKRPFALTKTKYLLMVGTGVGLSEVAGVDRLVGARVGSYVGVGIGVGLVVV